MPSISKRLDDLEKSKCARMDESRVVLVLPDNGRYSGGFHVTRPTDRVKIVPHSQSVWPDGSFVFDSLSNRPNDKTGQVDHLTREQWAELRKAEPHHQKKGTR